MKLNMVVVNATLAKNHSVNKLASALGGKEGCAVSAIRFDFIVPKGAEFTFGDITGRLGGWKNLRDGQWPNASTSGSESYTNCLTVAEVSRTA